jgi:hypothetical protein
MENYIFILQLIYKSNYSFVAQSCVLHMLSVKITIT